MPAGMKLVDIHTHKRGEGCYILDISDGKQVREEEWCSYGIHPLFIKGGKLEVLEQKARDKQIVAVGEAGLDRNAATELGEQLHWFEKEARIAEEYGLPLIIHCVRAFPELVSVYRRMRPRQAWIIHGYNNRKEILTELLKHGFYISAGKKLWVTGSPIHSLLPEIPLDRLFLETDDSDFRIREVYEKAAELLAIPVERLAGRIIRNFSAVFTNIQQI